MLDGDRRSVVQLLSAVTVGIVIVGIVLSGPLFGVFPLGTDTTELGDGTASVEAASVPTDELRVTAGRFGTDVQYLRVPDATVTTNTVEGQSRLVYRVEIPALDVEADTTSPLTESMGRVHRLKMNDVALRSVRADRTYNGTVTVRVQSFTVDKTVFSANITVQGGR